MVGSLLSVFGVSFDGVSPYFCTDYFQFGLGCWVATFWERAAHSVDHMFSLYFDYLRVGFWLISPVPSHCIFVTFNSIVLHVSA